MSDKKYSDFEAFFASERNSFALCAGQLCRRIPVPFIGTASGSEPAKSEAISPTFPRP
jgi:hypothetical protein